MRNVLKTLALVLAMALPLAVVAQGVEHKPIAGQVVNANDKANVDWTLEAQYLEDDTFELTFTANIKDGYHGYSLKDFSAPIFEFEEADGVTYEDGMIEPLPAEEHKDAFGDSQYVYYNKAVYVKKVKVEKKAEIKGFVQATICTNETNQCTANPADFAITLSKPASGWTMFAERVDVPVEVAEGEAVEGDKPKTEVKYVLTFTRTLGADEKRAKPAFEFDGKAKEFVTMGRAKTKDGVATCVSEPFSAKPGTVIKGKITENDETYEFTVKVGKKATTETSSDLDWGSIIQAILWGFAALMTPCVFPMVPMTVSFFIKGSQSPTQGRFRAMMYGFFIVALYVLPIAALVLLSNAFGTNVAGDTFNFISTHWIPNLIFFLIFMVFAASFFGAFEITMPSKLVNKSDEGADKGGLIGIFFMALTLVLVSFSCTGPIVGSVIISSASGGSVWMPIITMAAFAIAFALPFTLLAWFPSMLKNLPKSGGWLNSVKVVLGFIEVALGLKFLMTADQTMHWGLLDREVYVAIWIVTFALLGFYLLGKLRFAHDDEVTHISVLRLTLALGVFSFVVYLIPGMWGAPLNAISGYIPPMSTQDYQVDGRPKNVNADVKYGDFLHIPHNLRGYFDLDEAKAAAVKENKPIFVDVTGHACNNCREMETKVWSNDRVLPILDKDYIICALYVDDKTKVKDKNGNEVRLGVMNSKFVEEQWQVNAQPAYILLTPEGEVIDGPRGYNTDIDGFVRFLEGGKSGKSARVFEGVVKKVVKK